MSKHLTTLALMIALIWSTAAVTIAYASPLPQDPRPSDEGVEVVEVAAIVAAATALIAARPRAAAP